MNTLSDKSILITGGGSGIGLAAARLFLAEGARVAIAGRDADKLRRAADSLNGGDRLDPPCRRCNGPRTGAPLVEDVNRRFGRIDVLVNNAGLNIKERTLARTDAGTLAAPAGRQS